MAWMQESKDCGASLIVGRLEVKDEDFEKFKKMEKACWAKKPIVYYVIGLPKSWVPFIKTRIEDCADCFFWAAAFKKLQF